MISTATPYTNGRLQVAGLTFIQHADSVKQQTVAKEKGQTPPPPLFAWYGNKKLPEPEILASVRRLQHLGFVAC